MSDNTQRVTPDDLEGLPPELVEQLALSDADKADFSVLETLRAIGGAATIDVILIQHYKRTQVIMERNEVTNRLGRLVKRGLADRQGSQGVFKASKSGGSTPIPTLTEEESEADDDERAATG